MNKQTAEQELSRLRGEYRDLIKESETEYIWNRTSIWYLNFKAWILNKRIAKYRKIVRGK